MNPASHPFLRDQTLLTQQSLPPSPSPKQSSISETIQRKRREQKRVKISDQSQDEGQGDLIAESARRHQLLSSHRLSTTNVVLRGRGRKDFQVRRTGYLHWNPSYCPGSRVPTVPQKQKWHCFEKCFCKSGVVGQVRYPGTKKKGTRHPIMIMA
jgi:hypothetical protein